MPIKPIDLQTLFMQLGQLNKQHAAEKEAPVLQQAVQGNSFLEKEENAARTVRAVEDNAAEANKIKADEKGQGSMADSPSSGRQAEKEEQEKETIKDPDLGTRVDLSG